MKTVYIFVLLTLIVSSVSAQTETPFSVTTVVSAPHLTPGDSNIGLEFTLQNNMEASVSSAKVYLYIRYPFSASISPNNKLGELNYPGYLIASGGQGDEYTPYFSIGAHSAYKTTFKIDVDRNAKYGKYDLPYTVFYDGGKEFSGKITLEIKGETLIEIRNVQVNSNNSAVEPGEVFMIAVSFENVGDNGIKWLKLILNPRDRSLIPLYSDTERVFKDIPQGEKKEAQMWFSLEKDAAVKNYPIDLVLKYTDERGVEFNETRLVGLVASGRAALDIAKKTTEPTRIKENEPFTLTLKIENTGTGDASGVTAKLESPIEGDMVAYLGEIKKDDYSNAIFTLDGTKSGKKTGVLRITYKDDFGEHEIQRGLDLIVNPANSTNLLPVIIVIAGIAGAIYVWKRRKPGAP
uniref:Putative cell adhesion protein n=1 Tax=viral metagenome TaxID=1070528 RepID=A0A6M3M363_9ZZZZ